MSLAAVCAWSFLRAIAIALVAAILSKGVAAYVGWDEAASAAGPSFRARGMRSNGQAGSWRPYAPCVASRVASSGRSLLAPFLVPPLLVGYAYSRLALLLIHYPFWNDVTYGLLLLLKFFPAAVVIRVFAPPSPVSAEAIHLRAVVAAAR